jgi:hypothetical protein
MRIAKPILMVTTPLGLAIGLMEAYRLAGGLVVLVAALVGVFAIAMTQVYRVIRQEKRDAGVPKP